MQSVRSPRGTSLHSQCSLAAFTRSGGHRRRDECLPPCVSSTGGQPGGARSRAAAAVLAVVCVDAERSDAVAVDWRGLSQVSSRPSYRLLGREVFRGSMCSAARTATAFACVHACALVLVGGCVCNLVK